MARKYTNKLWDMMECNELILDDDDDNLEVEEN